ncbi:MetQ/NlpA family ABC transporter substrate-binding protein [Nosocomiicoccus massiliensis]|uniref:MetQ/NlpA family ABC transporter substrate-binding protein n=1 Tax=Nosocomiicoccus massiliensis TaxID=1232430 RepID=UPI0003FBE6E1|nr:MetQ/NlpA family ABC transporter substrate-binding protein [Nosocomiicoccus massiliensis]
MRGIITFLAGCLVVIGISSYLLSDKQGEVITIGATSGPFTDMVEKAIRPELEEMGYTVRVVEYSDWIQPNTALANGDIDANLFQNITFMNNYNEKNDENLIDLIQVPTAPMGLYSGKYKSLDDIENGSEVALPPDPVNMSRAFMVLEDSGLIELKEGYDMFDITENDIISNKMNLKFVYQDAGQLPRSVDQIGLSLVPGNFALASNMKLEDALILENMSEYFRNRIVVNDDLASDKIREDLIKAVQSEGFNKVIDEEFKGFDKPEDD